jgi:octaprenyl-diphosphate synthase
MKDLQKVLEDLAFDLKEIDKIILEFAVGKSPLIQEVSNHLIVSGGKRVRPILLLLAVRLCGAKNNVDQYNLAAALELIHSATLLHDDVVDASQIRRGKKTANAIWDNKASILVGDYLFSISFQLMVKSGNLSVLDLLAKASSTMADGEVMQLENSSDVALSQEKYLEIIFGKTAVLFSAACEAGALITKASNEEVQALRDFGKNLGIIFQIIDDFLDYSAAQKDLGKEIGTDFFEGKVTLPIILTYEKAEEQDRQAIAEFFVKNLHGNEKNQEDFAKMMMLIEKYQGFEASKNCAIIHYKKALSNLEIFADSVAKENLITILEYSLGRNS